VYEKPTLKQERFALEWFKEGNASQAYRDCYNAQNMKPETIWTEACLLLKNPKVAKRIQELRESTMLTADDIINEYEEAREVARLNDNASAMVAATAGKAKVLGLDKLTLAGDKDNPLRIVQGMSESELQDELRRIQLRLSSIDAE